MLRKLKLTLILALSILFFIPQVALAQTTDYNASQVVVTKVNAEADGNEKVIAKIYLRDKMNKPTKDKVFIATQRGSIDEFWVRQGKEWVKVASLSPENGDKIFYLDSKMIQAEVNEYLELGITSKVKGEVKLAVSVKGERELSQYLNGHASGAQAEIIPVKYQDETFQVEDKKYNKLELVSEENLFTHQENKLYLKVLDKDHKVQDLDENIRSIKLEAKVLEKPEKAKVLIEENPSLQDDISKEAVYLKFSGDQPGQYKLKVTMQIRHNSFLPTIVLEDVFTIDLKPKVFGAEKIELTINSPIAIVDDETYVLQTPAFIEEGRTFVPLRFIGEALGAQVQWLPDTQTIIVERPDTKAFLNINHHSIVLASGQAFYTDVAPFIKEGNTFLPFRIIGEVFGATITAENDTLGKVEKVIFKNE